MFFFPNLNKVWYRNAILMVRKVWRSNDCHQNFPFWFSALRAKCNLLIMAFKASVDIGVVFQYVKYKINNLLQ